MISPEIFDRPLLAAFLYWRGFRVRKDSRARLLKEGVIGDNIIEIVPGSEKSPEIAKGNEIVFERELGMTQLIGELYGDARPLLQDLRSTVRRADALLAELPTTRARGCGTGERAAQFREPVEDHRQRTTGHRTGWAGGGRGFQNRGFREAQLADQQQ